MNNFKVGDRVVCIDTNNYVFIKKYNIYTVTSSEYTYISVDNFNSIYYYKYFILLSDYRKMKLNKIFENE